jgi:hypothetical protein
MAKSREELMEVRKQMIAQMEQKLHESWSSEEVIAIESQHTKLKDLV